MRQIVIDLDEATLERLERVAPTRQRKRTEFIRTAIRRALDELAQAQIAEGYRRIPDDADPRYFVREQWEPVGPRRRRTRR